MATSVFGRRGQEFRMTSCMIGWVEYNLTLQLCDVTLWIQLLCNLTTNFIGGTGGPQLSRGGGWPHLRTATGQDAEETFLIFRPYRRIDFLPNLVGSISTLPHTTALETEVLALSARKFVTVCYVACEHLTSATNNFQHYWRYECLSRPRRFVTFYISTLEIFFTYLLTYLISLSHTSPSLCLPLSFLPFFFSFSFLPPSLSFSLILTSLIPVHHSHQIQL